MNATSSSSVLEEYRVQARLLLKDLRSDSADRRSGAVERFRALEIFADRSAAELAAPGGVRLKHALTVVALESGAGSWSELKTDLERRGLDEGTLMYDRGFDVLLNNWFARYEPARESLETVGGYLLPFKHQFLVCEWEAIRLLGLDPEDPDWERIGHDWVRPADREAWKRLRGRRVAILRERTD